MDYQELGNRTSRKLQTAGPRVGPLDAVALPTPALLGTECPVLPPADLTSPGSAAEGLYAKGQGRTAERLQVGTLGGPCC